MLISHPTAAVAAAIPTGVASADGRMLFVAAAHGIDALDIATGALAWSTTEAHLPVLALPDALLAIRGKPADEDDTWAGSGTLVAIDLASPHAARAGAPFELPLVRHRLLDVRADGGAVEAGWIATGWSAAPLAPRVAPIEGTLRIDLATGAATIAAGPRVPEDVRRDTAALTAWRAPWRTVAGWSALLAVPGAGGLQVALRHWPSAGGAATSAVVVDTARLDATTALHATATHLFLRACLPASAPTSCELQVVDAETGARVATVADVTGPGPDRLEPPLALLGRRLLATRSDLRSAARTLIALDLDHLAAGPTWRRSMSPPLLPNAQP